MYECRKIFRGDLTDLPRTLSAIWNFKQIEKLFKRILDAKYIE